MLIILNRVGLKQFIYCLFPVVDRDEPIDQRTLDFEGDLVQVNDSKIYKNKPRFLHEVPHVKQWLFPYSPLS